MPGSEKIARRNQRIGQAPSIERSVSGAPAVEALTPDELAQRPLFEPIADLLARCEAGGLPSCDALNRWSDVSSGLAASASGGMPRFVLPDKLQLAYEERVQAHGEIVTRPDNWHDFFNALVWLRFPRTKAALNAAHLRCMREHRGAAGRGPIRDALTQFDESGIVVASADAALLDLLTERRWKELFWVRRSAVLANMRFLVFGHGLYDALRAPFYCMCGRVAMFTVDRAMIGESAVALCEALDPLLAGRFAADFYPRPRALLALPLLGIPGMTDDNLAEAYYDDQQQFRPAPAWA